MLKTPMKTISEREQHQTFRQRIIEMLRGKTAGAREISQELALMEKEVYDHLEHIARSALGRGEKLRVIPPRCLKCDFIFKDRKKIKPPGRCPKCRNSYLEPALFKITK